MEACQLCRCSGDPGLKWAWLGPAQAMGAILAASPSPGLVGVARINWSSFFAGQPKVPCFLENFQHHKKSTGLVLRVLLLNRSLQQRETMRDLHPEVSLFVHP